MRHVAKVMVSGLALLVLAAGCATREYVAQRVEGMGFRMTAPEISVTETRDRADVALVKAEAVDRRLTRLWANRHSPKVVETVEVGFGFDRFDLSDGAQTRLLDLVTELRGNPGLVVEVTGYADATGARGYNYQLSQRRAEAVRRFLVEKGVQLWRIQAIGLGSVADPGTPPEKGRRVTVKLMLDAD